MAIAFVIFFVTLAIIVPAIIISYKMIGKDHNDHGVAAAWAVGIVGGAILLGSLITGLSGIGIQRERDCRVAFAQTERSVEDIRRVCK